jgi:YVTN family beta-propeller protein
MRRLSMIRVCPTTHGMGLSPDEKTLYVTCSQSDELAVLDVSDPAAPTVIKRIPVGPAPGPTTDPAYVPYALSVHPQDGTVWVSNNRTGDVRVYDPASGQMDPAKVVFLGGVAMFGSFTPDGRAILVPYQGADRLAAIEVATLIKTDVPMPAGSCLNAHAFRLAPSGTDGVLVCEGNKLDKPGTVVGVTLQPLVATGFVSVGMFSDGAAWIAPAP